MTMRERQYHQTVWMAVLKYITLMAFAVALISCSSGGGGGGTPDTTAPDIAITSHQDNETVLGVRDITLTGTVSSDTTSLSVTLNGSPVTPTQPTSSSFTVDLTLTDRLNTIAVTASDGSGNENDISLTLNYPFLSFTNGQAASVVIGQPDFTSSAPNQNGAAAANTLNSPGGRMALSDTGVLFVADGINNRVLAYSSIPESNNASAEFAIGQNDLITTDLGTGAGELRLPYSATIADGKLFIADSGNHRVLIFNQLPVGSGAVADVVVGQSDFGLSAGGCAADRLYYPADIMVVDTKLIISETGNHRVLIWNAIPQTNGAAADIVIGQDNFTTCTENDSDRNGVSGDIGANTLSSGGGSWSDGNKLFVADWGNHRVLIWNQFPTTNGQPADLVLGQANMTSAVPALSATGMEYPVNVASNGNQLFVSFGLEAITAPRVLIWDSIPQVTQAAADRILLQSTLAGTVNNEATQNAGTDAAGLLITATQLLVSDMFNSRILVFEAP
ncbi:MAG: hypothetical protein L0Z73_14585 [Gammaproteobacteria bacterium]|nr:hypothetical protein [Gammaproteobacteria bacterium]